MFIVEKKPLNSTHQKGIYFMFIYNVRGLSKKFVEFVNKNKSTRVVALKFLRV